MEELIGIIFFSVNRESRMYYHMLTFVGTRGNKNCEKENVDVESEETFHLNLLFLEEPLIQIVNERYLCSVLYNCFQYFEYVYVWCVRRGYSL